MNYSRNLHTLYITEENNNNYTVDDMCRMFRYEYALVIYGILFPVLVLLTTIANILAVCVFATIKMRSPTTTLLTGLALSDSLAGLVMTPLYIMYYSRGNRQVSYLQYPECFYHQNAYKIAAMLHAVSVWITTTLAAQRYFVIVYPMKGRWICGQKTSFVAIAMCYIASIVVHLPWFLGRYIDVVSMLDFQDNEVQVCFCMKTYDFKMLITILRLVLVQVVPCIILISTTIALVRQLVQETKRILHLHADDDDEGERKDFRHVRRTTVMIVVIVTCFIAVELPYAVVFMLDTLQYFVGIKLDSYDGETKRKIAVFINFFTYVSYHINFWVYVSLSKAFRQNLKAILHLDRLPCCRKRRRSLSRYESHTRSSPCQSVSNHINSIHLTSTGPRGRNQQ